MHPKSEDILKVINNLKKVLPQATRYNHLDMSCVFVNENGFFKHECGTVHCHGGWYAVATCDLRKRIRFGDGADQLTKDLGFDGDNYTPLTLWAEKNPDLWGNRNGYFMFCAHRAFDSEKRPFGARSLSDIIDHWTEVYERVKTEENKQKIEYPDLTKELAVLPIEETTDTNPPIVVNAGHN